jgi:hypothetical protein
MKTLIIENLLKRHQEIVKRNDYLRPPIRNYELAKEYRENEEKSKNIRQEIIREMSEINLHEVIIDDILLTNATTESFKISKHSIYEMMAIPHINELISPYVEQQFSKKLMIKKIKQTHEEGEF